MAGAALREPQITLTSDASGHCTECGCVGSRWKGLTVLCRCDNAAVVAIVNSGRSRMDRAMHLMRCLSFFLARWEVSLVCRHIPGVENGAADALSRDDLPSFQRLVPDAAREPSGLPGQLLRCVVSGTTGHRWTGLHCSVAVCKRIGRLHTTDVFMWATQIPTFL